jgi:hypothetical protein
MAKITWTDFLDVLERESNTRDKLNDLILYDIPVKRLKLVGYQNLRKNNDEFNKMYMYDKILTIRIRNREYLLVIFDNCEV